MSSDAKVWLSDGESEWTGWVGVHDAPITEACWQHTQGCGLTECLEAVERCAAGPSALSLRWEPYVYPDGTVGLLGYHA